VTGKPQCGLTTTIYSLIRRHDAFTQNIYSLEIDPEIDLDNITQQKLDRGAPPEQCARQLQSVLRADPDVVLVGFCNNADMAKIGTKAAREGKRLYFGMTQTSAFDALSEWLKMVGNPAYVADTIRLITYQVLLRKLCPDCREAYAPDPQMLRRLNLPVGKVKQFFRPPSEPEYDKHGNPLICAKCQGSGYYGRTAVMETIFFNEALKEVIKQGGDINAVRTQARKERVLYLQEQAIRKVIDGTTSIQEVLRVTSEKNGKTSTKPSEPAADMD